MPLTGPLTASASCSTAGSLAWLVDAVLSTSSDGRRWCAGPCSGRPNSSVPSGLPASGGAGSAEAAGSGERGGDSGGVSGCLSREEALSAASKA